MIMQYAENLTDRQAAETVRGRIDWKYALGMEMRDAGFHYSVLSEFRDRLIASGAERLLMDEMLLRFQEKGLLKARGKQRTDATRILTVARHLNRIGCVVETLRRALNEIAAISPDWLLDQVTTEWFDRYGPRFDSYRLPKKKGELHQLRREIGGDGYHLLSAIYKDMAPSYLKELPGVRILQKVWIQQYFRENGQVKWREAGNLPPQRLFIQTPYDEEARNRTKRKSNWTGYTVHLTETCDPDMPNIITNVVTTSASTNDVDVVATIHEELAEKELLPAEHYVDAGYMSIDRVIDSESDHTIDLMGCLLPDTSWQAREKNGYALTCFGIDWTKQTAICPQGKTSVKWQPRTESSGQNFIHVEFDETDCLACSARSACTKRETGARIIRIHPQIKHEMMQKTRHRQKTDEFKQKYKIRAGIEGTISQAVGPLNMRRNRYQGLAKTHLQHVATTAAINLHRAIAWLDGLTPAITRQSRFAALQPAT
jgi:transposase